MADQFTPLPVKTKTAGDVAVKVVDSAGTNLAAVDASGRVSVSLTASSATVTVDTELNTAAALADAASATVSTASIGAVGLVMNATTLDRQRAVVGGLDSVGTGIAAAGLVGQLDDTSTTAVTENQFAPVRISTRRALLVEGVASGTAIPVSIAAQVDTELPTAAALADNTANPTVPAVGSYLMAFDGANWDRVQTGAAATGSLKVDGSAVTQPVSIAAAVDTELPTAAALSDATANPTAPMVGAALMLWDGSANWKRAQINGSNQLLVTTAASVTAAKTDTLTSLALAASATVTVQGTQVASGKTGKVMGFTASSSVPCKVELHTVLNNGTGVVKVVLFTSAANPSVTYNPPDKGFITQAESVTAGFDGFAVKWTNLDTVLAADVYATVFWDEV